MVDPHPMAPLTLEMARKIIGRGDRRMNEGCHTDGVDTSISPKGSNRSIAAKRLGESLR